MMCSTQRGLEVAQHHIEPAEGLDLRARLAFGCDHHAMRKAQSLDHLKSQQPIGGHGAIRSKCNAGPGLQRRKREVLHRVKSHPHGLSVVHF
ncbi:hypothetical protein FEMY_24720 [Ferrovum myxofaciens]|uniref:Uncharacterized protein n=1 Tax=Ferrovum myxofaciens TaxID=416213 RepID=A0A149VUW9_9PROT|nr:hypothetical protein FEMY_24720 [Ferrovum myxofaciens]